MEGSSPVEYQYEMVVNIVAEMVVEYLKSNPNELEDQLVSTMDVELTNENVGKSNPDGIAA